MKMKKLVRRIGVGLLGLTMGCMVAIMVSSTVLAAAGVDAPEPNHLLTDGWGGCNSDKTWCWNIDLNPPLKHHYPQPIEVYGHQAKDLIAHGEIFQAELSPYGVFYIGVHSYRYRREFDCTVNVTRRSYHCTSQ